MNKKPNFLIVGAAKSGSTSLYHYLNQHPEVYMPRNKEPNYFVADYQKGMSKKCPSYNIDMRRMVFDSNDYYNLFNKVKEFHKAIGEASVTYLFKPDEAITKIKNELGDIKILIILRNPIKRAFSHYSYACELGFENLNFKEAIKMESERLNNNWSSTFAYISQGMFCKQLIAYKKAFSNVHILFLDDFINNKQHELKKIYNFLEIDPFFKNNFVENFNVSGIPKIRFFHKYFVHDNFFKKIFKKILKNFISEKMLSKMLRKARLLNQGEKMILTNEENEILKLIYKKDIQCLSKFLQKDLKFWYR